MEGGRERRERWREGKFRERVGCREGREWGRRGKGCEGVREAGR